MKFSIIVPTYNRRETLKKCLTSLLSQDYPLNEYEIIVVDDGSTDGTGEYLRSISDSKLNYYLSLHGGPAKARNFGAKNSHGVYLAFTDDDCLAPSDWLKELERGFARWPSAAAVGGYLEAPDEVLKRKVVAQLEGYETREVYQAGHREYLGGFDSPAGGSNNIVYRRDIFESLWGFDENIPVPAGEDADLKFRAVEAGYKIGYRPIKMTHLDPYSFKTFIKRSIRAGIGSAYFEKKHYQRSDSLLFLVLTITKAVSKTLVLTLISFRQNKLMIIRYVKEIFMNYGRILFLFKIKSG